jgi:hypothetical protein
MGNSGLTDAMVMLRTRSEVCKHKWFSMPMQVSMNLHWMSEFVVSHLVYCCMSLPLVGLASGDYVGHHCALIPYPGTAYLTSSNTY